MHAIAACPLSSMCRARISARSHTQCLFFSWVQMWLAAKCTFLCLTHALALEQGKRKGKMVAAAAMAAASVSKMRTSERARVWNECEQWNMYLRMYLRYKSRQPWMTWNSGMPVHFRTYYYFQNTRTYNIISVLISVVRSLARSFTRLHFSSSMLFGWLRRSTMTLVPDFLHTKISLSNRYTYVSTDRPTEPYMLQIAHSNTNLIHVCCEAIAALRRRQYMFLFLQKCSKNELPAVCIYRRRGVGQLLIYRTWILGSWVPSASRYAAPHTPAIMWRINTILQIALNTRGSFAFPLPSEYIVRMKGDNLVKCVF